MKIAITGSTGLIGSALTEHLRSAGHTVARMVRRESDLQPGDVLWSVDDQRLDPDDLVGTDAVVHLAGAPIGVRWTEENRAEIMSSRRDGTRLLAEALAGLDGGPEVFVATCAIAASKASPDSTEMVSMSRLSGSALRIASERLSATWRSHTSGPKNPNAPRAAATIELP